MECVVVDGEAAVFAGLLTDIERRVFEMNRETRGVLLKRVQHVIPLGNPAERHLVIYNSGTNTVAVHWDVAPFGYGRT